MRKWLPAVLIAACIIVAEIPAFIPCDPDYLVSWNYKGYVPMSVAWNLKYLAGQLQFIFVAAALMLYTHSRVNKSAAVMFFVYCVLDTIMYFYNYKQEHYWVVYPAIIITFVLHYNRRK